jgi:hypothetical protein
VIKFSLPSTLCIFAAAFLVGPFDAAALTTPAGTVLNTSSDVVFAPSSIWDNVGVAGDSTGEYLGNGWIITANHVARLSPTTTNFSLTLGATTYNWTGTGAQLGSHDIFLAQLAPDSFGKLPDDYGATGVPLVSSTPATGTATTMIGNGKTYASTSYYVPSGGSWPLSNFADPNAVAVHARTAGAKTWGTNTIWGTTAAGSLYPTTALPIANFHLAGDDALAADFSDTREAALPTSKDAATAFETGGALYDSGGGMFVNDGGVWKLAGLTNGVVAWNGQPGDTTTVSNNTIAIDLGSYAAQINAITATPEPTAGALLGIAGTVLAASTRRRKNSRAEG